MLVKRGANRTPAVTACVEPTGVSATRMRRSLKMVFSSLPDANDTSKVRGPVNVAEPYASSGTNENTPLKFLFARPLATQRTSLFTSRLCSTGLNHTVRLPAVALSSAVNAWSSTAASRSSPSMSVCSL